MHPLYCCCSPSKNITSQNPELTFIIFGDNNNNCPIYTHFFHLVIRGFFFYLYNPEFKSNSAALLEMHHKVAALYKEGSPKVGNGIENRCACWVVGAFLPQFYFSYCWTMQKNCKFYLFSQHSNILYFLFILHGVFFLNKGSRSQTEHHCSLQSLFLRLGDGFEVIFDSVNFYQHQ